MVSADGGRIVDGLDPNGTKIEFSMGPGETIELILLSGPLCVRPRLLNIIDNRDASRAPQSPHTHHGCADTARPSWAACTMESRCFTWGTSSREEE